MQFAKGMKEAMSVSQDFADDAEAAAFWKVGAADVPCRDLEYPGAVGQPQAARLYQGAEQGAAPVLLYIHGGGWAGGSIDLNERAARNIASESGWNVFSISYRLAPEHPYPAGLNDCRAALQWLGQNFAQLGVDPTRIVIGGASAGANLAITTALSEPTPNLLGLLLFYGVFGCNFGTESYQTFADGPGLTRARMQDLFDMYDGDAKRMVDPFISPILSDELASLPPSFVMAAEHDVLLDDSRAMAGALEAAEVPVKFHIEPGVTHGFINRGRLVPAGDAALKRAALYLKDLEDQKVTL
ncbi:MAG: alpha/beta hydrolase [Marinosulfonomonas sp.]